MKMRKKIGACVILFLLCSGARASEIQIMTTLQYNLMEFEKFDGEVTRRGMWLGNYGMNLGFPKLPFLARNIQINADTRTQASGETVTNTSSSGVSLSSAQDAYKVDLGYSELLTENFALGKAVIQSQLTKNMYGNFLFSKKGAPSFSLSLQESKTQNQLTSASSKTNAYQLGVRHSFGKLSVSFNHNVAQQQSSGKATDTSMDASYVIPIERHSTVVMSFQLRKTKSGSGTTNASILETNMQSRLTPSLSLSHRYSYQKQSSKGKTDETVIVSDEMTGFNYSLNSYGFLRLSFQNQEQNNGNELVTLSYFNAGADFTLSPDASLFLNYSRTRKSPQGSILTWTHSESYGATVNMKFFEGKGSLLNYTLLSSKAKEENSSTLSMNLSLMSEILSSRYETLNATYTRTWQKITKPGSSENSMTETLGLTYLLRTGSSTSWTVSLMPSRSSGKIQQKDILLSVNMAQIVSPTLTLNQSYTWKKNTVEQSQSPGTTTQDYMAQLNWQLPKQSTLGMRMQFTRNNPGDFKEYRNFSMNYTMMF